MSVCADFLVELRSSLNSKLSRQFPGYRRNRYRFGACLVAERGKNAQHPSLIEALIVFISLALSRFICQ